MASSVSIPAIEVLPGRDGPALAAFLWSAYYLGRRSVTWDDLKAFWSTRCRMCNEDIAHAVSNLSTGTARVRVRLLTNSVQFLGTSCLGLKGVTWKECRDAAITLREKGIILGACWEPHMAAAAGLWYLRIVDADYFDFTHTAFRALPDTWEREPKWLPPRFDEHRKRKPKRQLPVKESKRR